VASLSIPFLAATLGVPLPAHAPTPFGSQGAAEDLRPEIDEPSWRQVLTWLGGERDRLAADLETAHGKLLERAGERFPELAERLEPTPPRPTPTGYGVLPRLRGNDPFAQARPRERSYSLERVSTGFKGEMRDAALLAARAGEEDEARLEAQVDEFERLRKRLRDLEEHMSYHEWWQRAVVDDADYFAERNEIVAMTREWRRVLEAGDDRERARQLERELVERVAPFKATPGLAIERAADGSEILAVEVHTDITDEAFLTALAEGIDDSWNGAEAMGAARLRVEVAFVHHAGTELYAKGAPAHKEVIDTDEHLARFPAGALVITTGAASTHARVGRHVLLGPGALTPRTLAHEFGHLLGFTDAYLRGFDGSPTDRYGVVLVEWSGLLDDLMGDSRGGRVSAGMVERLRKAYGCP
jgi:hypothetical protein